MEGPIGEHLKNWEQFRRSSCTEEDRQWMIAEFLKVGDEDLLEFARRPDMSRVVQSVLKLAKGDSKEKIYSFLMLHIHPLTLGQYTHHVVLSMLKHGDKTHIAQIRSLIIKFAAKLIIHKFGVRVLEAVYAGSNLTTQKRILAHSIGRADINLMFSEDFHDSIEDVWAKDGRAKNACLTTLFKRLDKCVTRGLIDYTLVQRLVELYFRHGIQGSCVELVQGLVQPVVHICNSYYGSRVALHVLELGTPAQRAEMLSHFSKSVVEMCKDKSSYLLICRLFDVVDDIDAVRKKLLKEMMETPSTLKELLLDPVASKVFIHLLTPERERKVKILQPHHTDLLWNSGLGEAGNKRETRTKPQAGVVDVGTVEIFSRPVEGKHDAILSYLFRPDLSKTDVIPKCNSLSDILANSGEELRASFHATRVVTELVHFAENHAKSYPDVTRLINSEFLNLRAQFYTQKMMFATKQETKAEGSAVSKKRQRVANDSEKKKPARSTTVEPRPKKRKTT